MSTYQLGPALYDQDEQLWFLKMGIKTKKGMILHYTVWGITKDGCENKATTLKRILEAIRPENLTVEREIPYPFKVGDESESSE